MTGCKQAISSTSNVKDIRLTLKALGSYSSHPRKYKHIVYHWLSALLCDKSMIQAVRLRPGHPSITLDTSEEISNSDWGEETSFCVSLLREISYHESNVIVCRVI